MSELTYASRRDKPLVWLGGRINDAQRSWRIVYCIDREAIVILEVFAKKTMRTPRWVLESCRRRLRDYRQIR